MDDHQRRSIENDGCPVADAILSQIKHNGQRRRDGSIDLLTNDDFIATSIFVWSETVLL